MSTAADKRMRVSWSFPAEVELWVLGRMGMSAIAAQLDFGIDEVEDLRLAVNELCSTCAEGATAESRVELECMWDATSVEVTCAVDAIDGDRGAEAGTLAGDITETELSLRILAALVDEQRIDPSKDNVRRGWFLKEREPANH